MGALWDALKHMPRVSAMDHAVQTPNFIVTLNEFVFGFQSVSGISVNKKVDYLEEGGVNDHRIMVGCPSDDTPTLTFKRGYLMRCYSGLSDLHRAAAAIIPFSLLRKSALIAASALSPQEALEVGPALGTIQVFDRGHNLTALYSFLSLGMTSWRLDDLDATGTNVLCEEFTIAHQGLTRHPLRPPSIVGTIYDTVKFNESLQAEEGMRQKREEEVKAIKELNRKKEEERKAREELERLEAEERKQKEKEHRDKLKKEQEERREIQKQKDAELKERLKEHREKVEQENGVQ